MARHTKPIPARQSPDRSREYPRRFGAGRRDPDPHRAWRPRLMRAFRLCRTNYPAYDGEGARRVGGRWNSGGTRVLYMSENRSLAVLEILVQLSASIPDRYVLGAAENPDDVAVEILDESRLAANWSTLDPREQEPTRRIGDDWVVQQRSAML